MSDTRVSNFRKHTHARDIHEQQHTTWLAQVPMCIAQLEVTYADGSIERVAATSPDKWKAGGSPTLYNNIYLGEKYEYPMINFCLRHHTFI